MNEKLDIENYLRVDNVVDQEKARLKVKAKAKSYRRQQILIYALGLWAVLSTLSRSPVLVNPNET